MSVIIQFDEILRIAGFERLRCFVQILAARTDRHHSLLLDAVPELARVFEGTASEVSIKGLHSMARLFFRHGV